MIRRLAGLLMIVALASPGAARAAEAAPAPKPAAPTQFIFGFRGVGEVWQDPAIIQSYRSSRFGGAGFGAITLWGPLMAEAEVGFMRQDAAGGRTVPADAVPKKLLVRDPLTGEADTEAKYQIAGGSIELMPVTFSLMARKETGGAELFAGAGFAMAVFNEQTAVGAMSGVKPGLDLKAGARIHTNLVSPVIRTSGSRSISGMDVELLLGRRQHHAFGLGSGFDFSAWRIGIGLTARL
jgi:hypothetical protein